MVTRAMLYSFQSWLHKRILKSKNIFQLLLLNLKIYETKIPTSILWLHLGIPQIFKGTKNPRMDQVKFVEDSL